MRFAPSPNGYLHLGHAYSALLTRHWADHMGARFLLRIEDIDLNRCKPELTVALLDDLHWLGLSWDGEVWHQSRRFSHYQQAAETLRARGLLYPCFCSRSEIAARSSASDPDGAPIYPGTCRHLSPLAVAEALAEGKPHQWRLKTDAALAECGPLAYPLARPEPWQPVEWRAARPQIWGDVVLVRKDTPTSYHLSVVIDDAAQAITHVTRGVDMEAATDLHILLQSLLGLPTPTYTFHALLMDSDGRKLAKSRGSKSLRDLRAEGWTPADIRRAVGL